MYNEKYVKSFKEEQYISILNDIKQLDDIANNYLNRYSAGVDAHKLALKDSLDHYIAKQISENKNYINTLEFKNYANYLKKISNQKKYIYDNGYPIYLEFSTNIVFEYLNQNMLDKIYPGNKINSVISKNKDMLNIMLSKIRNKQQLSFRELQIISDYFDNKKDLKMEDYTKYLEYIFEPKNGVKSTPQIVSAILTYLPKFYGQEVQDSRAYLASIDGSNNNKIHIAHSSAAFPYTCFQFDIFKNVDLTSYQSVNSSRTKTFDKNDIMLLTMIAFHEFTHQKQRNDLLSGNKFDSAAMEINRFLRQYDSSYYNQNHDADEIEIEADEKSWLHCAWFAYKFMKDEKSLFSQCYDNLRDVRNRRAFSVKIDEHGLRKRYMDFDVEKTMSIIREHPEALKNYKNLSKIFDEKGRIKTDFLFEETIATTNAGREFCNHTLNNVPMDLLRAKINSGNYTAKQIEILINNFVEVPHYNALALRELKNTNFNTYNQTMSNLNISKELEKVYNYYFLECCHQIKKFNELLEIVSSRNIFSKQDIDSYRSFFENYYFEMFENINIPNVTSIEKVLANFGNSNNEQLQILARKTKILLQRKITSRKSNDSFTQSPQNTITIDSIKSAILQSTFTTLDMQKQQDDIKSVISSPNIADIQVHGSILPPEEH